eukprot:31307-Pelagococcus_subviridis.AAC.1
MCVAAASSTRFSFRLGTSAFALAESSATNAGALSDQVETTRKRRSKFTVTHHPSTSFYSAVCQFSRGRTVQNKVHRSVERGSDHMLKLRSG